MGTLGPGAGAGSRGKVEERFEPRGGSCARSPLARPPPHVLEPPPLSPDKRERSDRTGGTALLLLYAFLLDIILNTIKNTSIAVCSVCSVFEVYFFSFLTPGAFPPKLC